MPSQRIIIKTAPLPLMSSSVLVNVTKRRWFQIYEIPQGQTKRLSKQNLQIIVNNAVELAHFSAYSSKSGTILFKYFLKAITVPPLNRTTPSAPSFRDLGTPLFSTLPWLPLVSKIHNYWREENIGMAKI